MMSATPTKDRRNRKDLDMRLSCRVCGAVGLRYRNKSGLCNTCYKSLPAVSKACRTFDLGEVIQKYTTNVVAHYGAERAAYLLGLDAVVLDAAMRGRIAVSANDDDDVAEIARTVELDEQLIGLLIRRHRDLTPLPAALGELIKPWRKALRVELANERAAERKRRLKREADRARVMRFVPAVDAHLDASRPGNAYGRTSRGPARARGKLPMRVCLGLWGMGFGVNVVERISRRAGIGVSHATAGRLFKQAQRRFEGAVSVEAEDLAAEVNVRPVLAQLLG